MGPVATGGKKQPTFRTVRASRTVRPLMGNYGGVMVNYGELWVIMVELWGIMGIMGGLWGMMGNYGELGEIFFMGCF